MNCDFWLDKRVFLTGHTGFKGSWLALLLARLGAKVHGYALEPPTTPSLFQLAAVGELLSSCIADIRDHELLRKELTTFNPDIVFHLAAQSMVLPSYENPLETYATNVLGTASVLDAVRHLTQSCAVVNVTTDKVYENRHWLWGYRENDALGGRDPYSSSKACAELVARSFRDSFFADGAKRIPKIGVANARAGNVIGGGDWTPRQLIPDTIRAFAQKRPVILRHPQATRPWQHVLDCLSGYIVLAEALHGDAGRYASDWNFGPSDTNTRPVSHIVEMLAAQWGVEHSWECDSNQHAHEEMELRLNSQKAHDELRWACRLPIDEALAWTASWYRRQVEGASARALCEEQIERYMQLSIPK